MLKVIGITSYAHPNPAIAESFNSFRLLTKHDLKAARAESVALKKGLTAEEIKALADGYDEHDRKVFYVLNNLKPGDAIPDDKYVKVISSAPILLPIK